MQRGQGDDKPLGRVLVEENRIKKDVERMKWLKNQGSKDQSRIKKVTKPDRELERGEGKNSGLCEDFYLDKWDNGG